MSNAFDQLASTGWVYAGHFADGRWQEVHFRANSTSSYIIPGDEITAIDKVNIRCGPTRFDGTNWVNEKITGATDEGDKFIIKAISEVSDGYLWLKVAPATRNERPVSGFAYLGQYKDGAWVEMYFDSTDNNHGIEQGCEVVATGNVNIRSGYISFDRDKWINKPTIGLARKGENYRVEHVREIADGYYWLEIHPTDRDISRPANRGHLWIEVGDSDIKRAQQLVKQSNILLSEFLHSAKPLKAMPRPSGDVKPKLTIPAGQVFEVVGFKQSEKPGMRWINIQTALDSAAQAPSLADLDIKFPNGIWWEYPVAETTGGYDAKNRKTLINSFNIVIYGPSSIKSEIVHIVEECVKAAGVAAYGAFQAAPSPEIGVRIGAAFTAFKTSLAGCLSLKSIGDELASKFSIGYIRRGRWVDGLNLRCVMHSPTAETYRSLHNDIKDKLPDPVNKLIMFYIATQDIPQIDINFDCPPVLNDVLAALPDPKELREFVNAAEQLATDGGKKLISEVKEEATKAAQDFAHTVLSEIPGVAFRLVGDVAAGVQREAPEFVEKAVIPAVKDGAVILAPWIVIFDGSGDPIESLGNIIRHYLPF